MLRLTQKLGISKVPQIVEYFNDLALEKYNRSINSIDYVWTKDPKKLGTYRKIINQLYDETGSIEAYYSSLKNDEDERSAFLLALPENDYAGGCRVTINDHKGEASLPSETEGFKISERIPDIKIEHNLAEISHLIVRKGDNEKEFYDGIFNTLHVFFTEKNIRYMLIKAPVSKQKIYYRHARKYFNLIMQRDFESDGLNHEHYFCLYENPNFR